MGTPVTIYYSIYPQWLEGYATLTVFNWLEEDAYRTISLSELAPLDSLAHVALLSLAPTAI